MLCDTDDKKDIFHFMLHCTAYKDEGSQMYTPPKTYIECDKNIPGHFLLDKESIEENKELLFAIWKRRQYKKNLMCGQSWI